MIRLLVRISNKDVFALYDTGAGVSAISTALCKKLGVKFVDAKQSVFLANGVKLVSSGRANVLVDINGVKKMVVLRVFPKLQHNLIIGLDIIRLFGLEQRKDLCIYMDDCLCTVTDVSVPMDKSFDDWSVLMDQSADLFVGIGKSGKIRHRIDLISDKVVRHAYQNIPFHWQKSLAEHIDELLKMDVIRESKSEFRSRIVPIKKKDGSVRMAIDYRDLNKITRQDAFPMPRIRDILMKVAKARIFSKLDLKKGYYNILMEESSRKYTAFAFGNKLYEFNRMPFGLVSAPQTFQRMMEMTLGHLPFVECYLDDIIVYSNNLVQHRQHLAEVFDILKREKLRLNREKCELGRSAIDYLGFRIDGGKRSIIASNKKKILDFPVPSCSREAKTFVCLSNYYRDLIPGFAKLAAPLFFCSNQKKFVWSDECQEAFDKLKMAIRQDPTLMIPDPDLPFIVTTDASDLSFGGVLSQIINREKVPVDFFSRSFNKAQVRYGTYDKEATAIMEALKHWRHLLIGKPFKIESDHRPLQWLLSKKDCSGRLGRMVMKLQEYQIENIDYVKGSDNILADALSRLQINLVEDSESEDCVILKDRNNFVNLDNRWFFVDKSKERQIFRLYIRDEDEKKKILRTIHDNGHFGLFKNEEEVRRRFWWPNWRKDVREMVYGCRRCEAFKSNAEKTKLPMIPSDVEYTNWNRLGLDICGPLSLSSKGFKYIVVLQDYATKFMVAGAFKDTRTENLVSWLIEIFSMFGWPAVLVCDRGSQFESAMFNKFLADNNIKLNFASVGHHQTNGLAERAIRTVEDMLRTSVLDQADWDVALPKLIAAYNASINFSTKESPFKLLFGHNMSTPLDLKFGIRHEMSDLVELSQKRILANRSAQTLQKFQYDKDVKLEVLEPGDLVLWHQLDRALGSSKKLNKRWRGPFKIRAKEGPNFLIVDNFGNTRWIHHNHLKKVDSLFGESSNDILRSRGRPRLFNRGGEE